MTATRIDVTPSDGGPPYQVVVGVGVLGELPGLVPRGARTVVVIHAEGLGEIARPACGALRAAGLIVHAEPVPDGEAAKTIQVAAGLWSRLAKHGVTRSDCVVGIGGGAATDLAGFVAATWLRGVRVVLVPTTVLGMADAAVGGKTAIDITCGQEPGRSVPLPGRRARRPGHAGDAAARGLRQRAGRGDQDRVHRRPGDPRPGARGPGGRRGPARRARARADRARHRGQGRGGVEGPDRNRPAGDPQLRAHARPRHRAGGGIPVQARPRGGHRHGVRRRAGPAGRPAGRR